MDLIKSNKGQFPDNEPAIPSKISGLKFNNIIDLLPCSISIQNSELQIVLVNQNFKKNFGDATGKLCYTVYKGSNEVCPSCPVVKSFRDKRMHIREETVQLRNGNRCQMLIQTSPILDDYGEVAAVFEMAT
ncbi:MAG: PAS domain-containing protein, partial [Desulfobacterales bacterium]